jgi:hypothetical protein
MKRHLYERESLYSAKERRFVKVPTLLRVYFYSFRDKFPSFDLETVEDVVAYIESHPETRPGPLWHPTREARAVISSLDRNPLMWDDVLPEGREI